MKKRYDEIMDKIEVTDEMRSRVLKNIQNIDLEQNKTDRIIRFTPIKKYLSVAACFVLLLVGAMTIPNLVRTEIPDNPDVLLPENGIVEAASAQELTDIIGFEIADITCLPFHAAETAYLSYWAELGEIEYTGEGQMAVFRKSVGNEDNSGDYSFYESETEIQVGTCTVTLKGNGGNYTLAYWSDNNFSYSLNLSNGILENEWTDIVSSISENEK